jgi:threonine/homoserine/homoserine lactone efflux protein
MAATHNIAFFLLAVGILNVTPGPDMLYITTRSLGQGARAGIVAAMGTSLGYVAHTTAAAVGLSGILMSSVAAFDAVRYAGAAYLLYLGARMVLCGQATDSQVALKRANLWVIFRQGLLTNALNPKVALFFLALLPQFVNPSRGWIAGQFVVLGLIIMTSAIVFGLVLALLVGLIGGTFKRDPRISRVQECIAGSIFIGLGLRLALSKRSS